MPRVPRLTAEQYWEAYGGLRQRCYIPTLSLVGLARALGVRQWNRTLGAFTYLTAHSVCGDWLNDEGSTAYNPEQYEALLEFLAQVPAIRFADDDGPALDETKIPEHLRDAEPVMQLAYFTSVVSATYEQVGSMYPDQAESSRPKTAGRALKKLEDAKAIERVYKGNPGKASLYVFLPIVFGDACPATWHWWGDEYGLSDTDLDMKAAFNRPFPEWPWPDPTKPS